MALQPALAVPLAVVAGAVVVLGLSELRLANRVRSEQPDSVVEAPDGGELELAGEAAVAGGTVTAPFSGTECLVCDYEVQEYRSSGKHSSWQTVDDDVVGTSFLLDDGSGTVLVDPRSATRNLATEMEYEVDGGETPPDRIRRFIESTPDLDSEDHTYDLKVVELKGGNDRRYVERRLDVGATVHVLGEAESGVDLGSDRGSVNARIRAPDVGSSGFVGGLYRRLVGRPFVVADAHQGEAAWRIAKPGVVYLALGLAGLGVIYWLSVPA
jgi:hypothetical protein